jgi:hypothetical protein
MSSGRNAVRAVFLGVVTIAAAPAMGAENIDPEADQILKSMSSYLANTRAFSINTDVALELLLKNGQKLQLISSQTLSVRRPAEFRIQYKGRVADAEFTFDGKTLTLLSKKRNAYLQREVPGSIENAVRAWEFETGNIAPGMDLLLPSGDRRNGNQRFAGWGSLGHRRPTGDAR